MKQEERVSVSKEKILEAAIQEFGNKGYKEASTNEICESCNISKGLIFYYFKSKEILFCECADYCIREFDSYMKKSFKKTNDPSKDIRTCGILRKGYFLEHPFYYRILCEILFASPGIKREKYLYLYEKYKKHRFDIVQSILEGVPLNPRTSREESIHCAVMMIEAVDIETLNTYPQAELMEQALETQISNYEVYLEILLHGILAK